MALQDLVPDQPNPNQALIDEIARKREAVMKMLQERQVSSPEDIDQINREEFGMVTNIAKASQPRTGNRNIAAENAAREEERKRQDAELRTQDPFVNSALINFAREDAKRAGVPFDEEVAEEVVKSQLAKGDADMGKISAIIQARNIDSTINNMKKQRDALQVQEELTELTTPAAEVDPNTFELDKSAKRKVFEEIKELSSSLRSASQITQLFDENFFDTIQKSNIRLQALSEKTIGVGVNKPLLRRFRVFNQKVEAMFQKYRKLITGAAASVQELQELRKATLNGDLSPSQAVGALAGMRSEIALEIEAKKRLLKEGLSLEAFQGDVGSYRERLDAEYEKMASENENIARMLQTAKEGRAIRRSLLQSKGSGTTLEQVRAEIARRRAGG